MRDSNIQYNAVTFSAIQFDSIEQYETILKNNTARYITVHAVHHRTSQWRKKSNIRYNQASSIQFGPLFHFSFILPLTIIVNFYTSHLLQHGEVLTKVNATGRYNNIPYCQAFRRQVHPYVPVDPKKDGNSSPRAV